MAFLDVQRAGLRDWKHKPVNYAAECNYTLTMTAERVASTKGGDLVAPTVHLASPDTRHRERFRSRELVRLQARTYATH